MQMREDVTACFVIQLIQCNGKILIMSSPTLVQEGLLAAVVFYVLHRFPNRNILG